MVSRSTTLGLRLLVAVLAAAVLAYGGYVASANLFLSSSLADRVINRKPERLRVTWTAARTWLPGTVVLDGVEIVGANRQFDWDAKLDHVRVHLSMWRLALRILHTDSIEGRGLVFRLRERPPEAANVVVPAAVGSTAEPEPDAGHAPAPRRRWRQPWRLDLEGIAISDLREITIGKSTLLGAGDLSGGLGVELKGLLRFDRLRLSFAGARFLEGGEPMGDDVTFTVTLSADPFEPGKDTAREILAGVEGEITLGANVQSLGALDLLLRKPDWLSFSGAGRLDTAFRVDDGEVLSGGHLDFVASPLEARVLDWTAEGDGRIAARLPESGKPAVVLDVDFGSFTVRRGEREAAHVSGENLRVAIEAEALDLTKGLEGVDLRVDLPPSRVDFVAYNNYLPASAFRIERGQGTLSSWFEYSDRDGMGRGEVAIDVAGAAGVAGDLGLQGDLALRTKVRGGDFDAMRFDVSGSTLALKNVRITRPGGKVESDGWWATFATEKARLDMKEPIDAEIVVRGKLRDAKPFLTALASRRKALFWLDNVIDVKDVEGRAAIDVHRDTLAARDVAITGDRLEIYGDVGTRGGERDGLLYIKYGPFAAALEIEHGERNWNLFHARRWFEERRKAREAARLARAS